MIVLTDSSAVHELMVKQSANTADRPASHISKLVTNGKNMVRSSLSFHMFE